jgi:predicted molibdopterin-dependent oxidoreductase YjgC
MTYVQLMNGPNEKTVPRLPLFRPLQGESRVLQVEIDGAPATARECDTVAGLLLSTLEPALYRRSVVCGLPRAPLCMMGVCFECLVEIDGQPNQQGCLARVREGMRIRRQMGS